MGILSQTQAVALGAALLTSSASAKADTSGIAPQDSPTKLLLNLSVAACHSPSDSARPRHEGLEELFAASQKATPRSVNGGSVVTESKASTEEIIGFITGKSNGAEAVHSPAQLTIEMQVSIQNIGIALQSNPDFKLQDLIDYVSDQSPASLDRLKQLNERALAGTLTVDLLDDLRNIKELQKLGYLQHPAFEVGYNIDLMPENQNYQALKDAFAELSDALKAGAISQDQFDKLYQSRLDEFTPFQRSYSGQDEELDVLVEDTRQAIRHFQAVEEAIERGWLAPDQKDSALQLTPAEREGFNTSMDTQRSLARISPFFQEGYQLPFSPEEFASKDAGERQLIYGRLEGLAEAVKAGTLDAEVAKNFFVKYNEEEQLAILTQASEIEYEEAEVQKGYFSQKISKKEYDDFKNGKIEFKDIESRLN